MATRSGRGSMAAKKGAVGIVPETTEAPATAEALPSRERIVETAMRLFEERGYHATGIAELVKESGAPRGSVYFHFPGGKEQIAVEAVERAGARLAGRVRENFPKSGPEGKLDCDGALVAFLERVAFQVERSGFRAGGPLLIVASETASGGGLIGDACRKAYEGLATAFREALEACGCAAEAASSLALTILAAVEGAIVLSRSFRSADPLRRVAADLGVLLRAASSRA
ncbi:MAG: TetR/AcrR family transcriptional regulator [Spirochaetales bacterium]|nr:TetR/AcrR family transcriptional regulator [Spirochaetales bacterium]